MINHCRMWEEHIVAVSLGDVRHTYSRRKKRRRTKKKKKEEEEEDAEEKQRAEKEG